VASRAFLPVLLRIIILNSITNIKIRGRSKLGGERIDEMIGVAHGGEIEMGRGGGRVRIQ
jgi:hypothetical protein